MRPATAAANRDADAKAPGRVWDRNGPLERVTVNLTARAALALDVATGLTGDTRTDTINRALQIYAFLKQVTARGRTIYIGEAADSEVERFKIF